MTALTELMAGRGYPLSALYPATMTIYRSLGWEIAGHRHEAVLPSRALAVMARPEPGAAAGIRRPGPADAAEVLQVLGRAHADARDAPAAIAARGFPATDLAVSLLITDDLRPANSGRWDLTVRAGEGRLSRHRTVAPSASPDGPSHAGCAPLALGARGLAALYAGTPVATLRRAGTLILADGGSQDADAALDGAFAATPFMLDGF
jgi:hypothetical protein